jgi:hypothetical protein
MVRYIANDIQAAVAFYTRHLNLSAFALSGTEFARPTRENLQLVLSPPRGRRRQIRSDADGRRPERRGGSGSS